MTPSQHPETGWVAFPGISAAAFQHPDDRKATAALEAVPLLPQILRWIQGSAYESKMRMDLLTTAVRLSPSQGSHLYRKFVRAAEILDLPALPEIYVNGDHSVNAFAMGFSRYFVSLNRGLVEIMDEGELLAIIGHELGHIKCAHMTNKSLAHVFATVGVNNLSSAFPGFGTIAALAIQSSLAHWSRMAELSCDRAALLVVQNPELVARALAKLAGFHPSIFPDLNFEELSRQIKDYDSYDQTISQAILKLEKVITESIGATHPWPVLRVKRIIDWGKSDHYRDILGGDYIRSPVKTLAAPQS